MTLPVSITPMYGDNKCNGYSYNLFNSKLGPVIMQNQFDEIVNNFEQSVDKTTKLAHEYILKHSQLLKDFNSEIKNYCDIHDNDTRSLRNTNYCLLALSSVLIIAVAALIITLLIVLV